jgi:hypothetical protein
MKKFWTVVGGVIGTAHLNRDNQPVDFRPHRTIGVCGYTPALIRITPQYGVQCEPLTLTATLVSTTTMSDSVLCLQEWAAEFQGVAVRAQRSVRRDETDEEKAQRLSEEARDRAANDAIREFYRSPDAILAWGRPTHREVGRMQSPYDIRRYNAASAVVDRACRRAGRVSTHIPPSTVLAVIERFSGIS